MGGSGSGSGVGGGSSGSGNGRLKILKQFVIQKHTSQCLYI